jgi:hypothetical protein
MNRPVANRAMFLKRHETTLRRCAVVIRNLLIFLVRQSLVVVLRRSAAVARERSFGVCGGFAAVVSVVPPYPPAPTRLRKRGAAR